MEGLKLNQYAKFDEGIQNPNFQKRKTQKQNN